MIIIRNQGAKSLSSILSVRADKLYFPNLLVRAQVVHIIYFDQTLKIETFEKRPMKAIRMLGEIERKDLAFIVLVDTKCNVDTRKEYLNIVNANCFKYDDLIDALPEKLFENKNDIFKEIFKRYIDFRDDKSFPNVFTSFLSMLAYEELFPRDLVFMTVLKTGEIYNANPGLGKFYDDKKVWYFHEKYDYDASKIDMAKTFETFSIDYEAKKPILAIDLGNYSEPELTKIIAKYPKVFADMILTDYSYFREEDYFHLDPEDEGEYWENHFDDAENAPIGYKLCISCESYCPETDTEEIIVEGKDVDICHPCNESFGPQESNLKRSEDNSDYGIYV